MEVGRVELPSFGDQILNEQPFLVTVRSVLLGAGLCLLSSPHLSGPSEEVLLPRKYPQCGSVASRLGGLPAKTLGQTVTSERDGLNCER